MSILICKVKTADINMDKIKKTGDESLNNAKELINNNSNKQLERYKEKIDEKTIDFINY